MCGIHQITSFKFEKWFPAIMISTLLSKKPVPVILDPTRYDSVCVIGAMYTM